MGTVVKHLELMVQRKVLHKMKNIMDHPEHPLQNTVIQQQSVFSQRLLHILWNTDYSRRYFLPTAIIFYNKSLKRLKS